MCSEVEDHVDRIGWGRRRDEGASAVEFALVFPLIVLLIFGILQFGQLLGTYVTITNLAREGARQATVGKLGEWLGTAPAPANLASGISISGSDAVPPGQPVTVVVTYTFPTTLNIPVYGPLPNTISSSATMRRE